MSEKIYITSVQWEQAKKKALEQHKTPGSYTTTTDNIIITSGHAFTHAPPPEIITVPVIIAIKPDGTLDCLPGEGVEVGE